MPLELPRPGVIPVTFAASADGEWRIARIAPARGEGLPPAVALRRTEGPSAPPNRGAWILRGVTGHARYTTRAEKATLDPVSPGLGRPDCDRAALIPIRKAPEWWALPQDERRAILEERSHHIETGLRYLPAIARRLYHARELGEPFDFLTWFEYSAADAAAFEDLVGRLRETEEWRYVEREIDVRLTRA